ncbi:nicotinamide-nucleotide amidohydrolase family protein [Inquilinus sp. CAU 1745]|uniref:CinA family protein n=1 Tax=Inquilinus sp. CAU 1745 TaxID=3140369 RepID=UPI00325AB165
MSADAIRLIDACRARGWRVATAESCTGGLIGAAITTIAGSSDVYERGFVTYSNEAKTELLDVPAVLIAEVGAVSAEVAEAMARGALARSRADLAISVTGVAGPGGGTEAKPVGLVYIGIMKRGGKPVAHCFIFPGDREAVRLSSVRAALELAAEAVESSGSRP